MLLPSCSGQPATWSFGRKPHLEAIFGVKEIFNRADAKNYHSWENHTIDDDKAVLRLKCGNSWSLELLRFFTKKRIEAAGIVRHALMPPDVLVEDGDEEELDVLVGDGDEEELDQLSFPPRGNMRREKTKCLVNFPGCEDCKISQLPFCF